MLAVTTGSWNTVMGQGAGKAITDGHENVIIGQEAGDVTTSVGYSVIIGAAACGGGDMTAAADGTVSIGYAAGAALTSGAGNTALGYQSLTSNTAGSKNVAVGYQTLYTANDNDNDGSVAVGYQALYTLNGNSGSVGDSSTVGVGFEAGKVLSTGKYNTAIGHQALLTEDTGSDNTAVGYRALQLTNNSTGDNTAVGKKAGDVIVAGYQNTIIGAESDPDGSSGINQITLGYGVTGAGNNRAVIGNNDIDIVMMAMDGDAVVYCGGINMSNNQPAPDAGTSTDETLDGYEEGTWTPVIGVNSGSPGFSYNNRNGQYTKIGRLVTVWFQADISVTSATGDTVALTASSLPFTPINSAINALYTYGGFAIAGSSANEVLLRGNNNTPASADSFYFMNNAGTGAAIATATYSGQMTYEV